jgi:hypothetical protein
MSALLKSLCQSRNIGFLAMGKKIGILRLQNNGDFQEKALELNVADIRG